MEDSGNGIPLILDLQEFILPWSSRNDGGWELERDALKCG
jgi:hypothetical protein